MDDDERRRALAPSSCILAYSQAKWNPAEITWGAQGLLKGWGALLHRGRCVPSAGPARLWPRAREPFTRSDQAASSARRAPRTPLTLLHDAPTAELQSLARWAGPGLCRARVRHRRSLSAGDHAHEHDTARRTLTHVRPETRPWRAYS
jgi:hypothetical protein